MGGEAEAGWNWWAKHELRQNEILLPFVKLWVKLFFFDTSTYTGIYLYDMYIFCIYIYIYIYLQKYFFAVSWISHPFFSEACPVQCIEGQCKLCSCPEVTKFGWSGKCVAAWQSVIRTQWRLCWWCASHRTALMMLQRCVTGSRAIAGVRTDG